MQFSLAKSLCKAEAKAAAGDINGDGIIDIFDLVLVGIHYGETESPWP